jgi:uncharacterized protein (TIGR00106 family)
MPNVDVDVDVVPVGTESTSFSDFVAACELVLKDFPEVKYQINPMSTTLEGELDQVMEVVKRMHQAPFAQGVQRVSTSIRIDDRRDKFSTLEEKVAVVKEKAHV